MHDRYERLDGNWRNKTAYGRLRRYYTQDWIGEMMYICRSVEIDFLSEAFRASYMAF